MKKIAIGALKGGVGKTMCCVSIASCLSESGKVLLVDCDPQSDCTSGVRSGDATLSDEGDGTLIDVFASRKTRPEDVVVKGPIEELPNLDLIPSHLYLTATELQLVARAGRERILDNFMKENSEFFQRYDYVIMDTNPGMSILNQNAFCAADSIILVSDISKNSLKGIHKFCELWSGICMDLGKRFNVDAIIVNNYDARINNSEQVIEAIMVDEELAGLLVKPAVPQRVNLKNAEARETPINVYKPNSQEHVAFKAVIERLQEKGVL